MAAASDWAAEGCGGKEGLLGRARLEQLEALEANYRYGRGVSCQLSVVRHHEGGASHGIDTTGLSRSVGLPKRQNGSSGRM
jgi:hypothetical protein